MKVDPSLDTRQAAYEAASAARGRAMTAFEEHLGDAVMCLAQSIEQLNQKLDAIQGADGKSSS